MPSTPSSIPRSEYPRPQFVREEWLCLNGEWEFAFDDANKGLQEHWFDGRALPLKIMVPFAYQAALSTINDKGVHEVVWYARDLKIPKQWQGKQLLLHFGAVDYRCTVWINGEEVGHNQGGHISFSFDIAPYIKSGSNRIVLRVEDQQDPYQPRGKQSVSGVPGEVDYYCTTGIWQTVWIEPVEKLRIEHLHITPLFKQRALSILVHLHAPAAHWRLQVKISKEGKPIAQSFQNTVNATSLLTVKIPNAQLWTPETPHLYDIEISLYKGDQLIDSIQSYAAMRGVKVKDGRFYLNNHPRYLAMVLDQGYWPDGGMTAPTDESLKRDVELIKSFGFNGVRKHQKVEDPRWLYWCDVLGLMVWSEMANARAWSQRAEELLLAEWERAVRRDYNHPCIISWVPMNESWGVPEARNHPGQFAYLERIVMRTRQLDQFRPIVDNDGWEHTDITDICAIHDYAATGEELRRGYQEMLSGGPVRQYAWANNIPIFARNSEYHNQPIMLTEVGGFLSIPEDVPEDQRDVLYKAYGTLKSDSELMDRYRDLMEALATLPFVVGFCYTQLTDVEHEKNGLLNYGRQPKCDPAEIKALHQKLFRDL